MENFGALGEFGGVGDVERWQQGGVDLLVMAVALLGEVFLAEIHEHHAFVGLDHPVLETGGDAEFLGFHRKDEVGEHGGADAHTVVGHQSAEAGGDDGARSGHADVVRDVGVVADGEVVGVETDAALPAVVVKPFHRGLEEAQAAVISERPRVFHQIADAFETHFVAPGRFDDQLRRFPKGNFRRKIADDERDRLAVVAVGRIADQAGTGVGSGADDHERAI